MVVMWIWIAVAVVTLIALWKVFTKAGQPGWASIVPIYNIYIMTVIAGKPAWWIVLFFIPIANLIAAIIVNIAMAERFGKGAGFGLGLAFLPMIFAPILAFGSAKYLGVASAQPPAPPAAAE